MSLPSTLFHLSATVSSSRIHISKPSFGLSFASGRCEIKRKKESNTLLVGVDRSFQSDIAFANFARITCLLLLFYTTLKIVVDFTVSWCGPCWFIAPFLEKLAKKLPNVTFLKFDMDELKSIAGSTVCWTDHLTGTRTGTYYLGTMVGYDGLSLGRWPIGPDHRF
ncbi:Thioredoxin H1 [Capsicum chinense]|nr:Thioredoxin H1 [Capsicum chinense]